MCTSVQAVPQVLYQVQCTVHPRSVFLRMSPQQGPYTIVYNLHMQAGNVCVYAYIWIYLICQTEIERPPAQKYSISLYQNSSSPVTDKHKKCMKCKNFNIFFLLIHFSQFSWVFYLVFKAIAVQCSFSSSLEGKRLTWQVPSSREHTNGKDV